MSQCLLDLVYIDRSVSVFVELPECHFKLGVVDLNRVCCHRVDELHIGNLAILIGVVTFHCLLNEVIVKAKVVQYLLHFLECQHSTFVFVNCLETLFHIFEFFLVHTA